MSTNDTNPQSCAKCRFTTLLQQLRTTLNDNLSLCQDCYARLNELTARYKQHPEIPNYLLQEARDEIHRLNVMKVRYEDIVEALNRGETRLSSGELEELSALIRVFDDGIKDMQETVGKQLVDRKREEERLRGRRNGIITRLDGLSLGDETDGKGKERAQSGYDYWNAPQGDFI